MIFRDGDFWIGKGPREFFSRVPLKGLRLKMGSMVVLPFSHLVLFVYTQIELIPCEIVGSSTKFQKIISNLNESRQVKSILFRFVFS